MDASNLAANFSRYSVQKLDDHFAQIKRCARMLSIDQLWFRANGHSNSIGNLFLHLRGNITQWIIGGLAGRPYERHRQTEFDHREPIPAERLIADLQSTLDAASSIIRGLDAAALERHYTIQEYRVTGVEAVYHIVEHFAFHTGQIVTTTKWLLDCDLSLYDEKGHRFDGRTQQVP
jgi:uncharacterized damage-inducible protein DinB